MKYFKIMINFIILYIKKLLKKGNIITPFWQNIHPTVNIITFKNSVLSFGKNVIIERNGYLHVGENANFKIGKKTYFNQGLYVSCKEKITIGSNCLFGPNVKVIDNNHKFKKDIGVLFDYNSSPIYIGNNCWIASNVVILKGTTIGDNCVIGAGCVVEGQIPSNSIVKQVQNNIIIEMRN